MTTEREGLVDLLAEHRFEWRTAGTWCVCGWGGGHMHHADYDRHLADALADLLAARDRRVRGEALREAAGAYLHDYPEIRDDLRDRADRIEGEPRRIHYDVVFADETAAMAIARDADTGEVLAVGVDVTRPKEEK